MKNNQSRQKLFARILALVLAVLMVGGTLYSLIYMLVFSARAADVSLPTDDVRMRVGIMYDNGVTPSFETSTVAGFQLGIVPTDGGEYPFRPLWTLYETSLSVAVDANLSKSGGGYTTAASGVAIIAGGYHVEFRTDILPGEAVFFQQLLTQVATGAMSLGYNCFPACVSGVLRIRVGSFASQLQAEAALPSIAAIFPISAAAVVGPSDTTVTVLNPTTDRILFEYDCADGTSLGMSAVQSGAELAYLKTTKGNIYDGVFTYNRFAPAGRTGVSVTNIVTLDQYAAGVLPFEISNTWPIETQKAFAIAARSYAAHGLLLHRHAASHFDLCNDIHCQVYCGAGRVNDNVLEAVSSTHGLLITHGDEIAVAYYSSSCGGYTVSIGDVWGGASSPYLVAHATPWERYSEHSNGFWTAEATPAALCNSLRAKGYTDLAGVITRLEVLEYAPGSTYIKTLRVTASNGASVTITNTDRVRTALSDYVKSANFVVGQGSVAYTVDTVEVVGDVVIDAAVVKTVRPPLADAFSTYVSTTVELPSAPDAEQAIASGSLGVLTGSGPITLPPDGLEIVGAAGRPLLPQDVSICTGAGILQSFLSGIRQLAAVLTGAMQVPRTVKEYTVRTDSRVAAASDTGKFIFVGKGWGHGAGLSQYGAKDLADLGYDYEAIINAYFTDVTITHYKTRKAFQ